MNYLGCAKAMWLNMLVDLGSLSYLELYFFCFLQFSPSNAWVLSEITWIAQQT